MTRLSWYELSSILRLPFYSQITICFYLLIFEHSFYDNFFSQWHVQKSCCSIHSLFVDILWLESHHKPYKMAGCLWNCCCGMWKILLFLGSENAFQMSLVKPTPKRSKQPGIARKISPGTNEFLSKNKKATWSAGKRGWPSCDWFWFGIWLVQKVARVLWTNHLSK